MHMLPNLSLTAAERACIRPNRNMHMPVFKEQRLSNLSTSPAHNAALPLLPPSNRSRSQALQLATNGDVLIGRSDNGASLERPMGPVGRH